MKKISPLLILMIIAIIQAIQIFFSESDGQGWGLLLAFALIGFAIGFLIVDLLLKRFIKKLEKINDRRKRNCSSFYSLVSISK
jgi:uncharacterized membrane-anchored protein